MLRRSANLMFVVLVVCQGCAGYQIGNQISFPGNVRTVHVPIVESESHRQFIGQQLTEAIVSQIVLDTPLQIADPALAESFLRCRIVRERKRQRTLDEFGEPRVLQADWVVEVEWVDRSGTPLTRRDDLRIRGDVDFIPEGGQSLSTAHKEVMAQIAQQIVGQMEARW